MFDVEFQTAFNFQNNCTLTSWKDTPWGKHYVQMILLNKTRFHYLLSDYSHLKVGSFRILDELNWRELRELNITILLYRWGSLGSTISSD